MSDSAWVPSPMPNGLSPENCSEPLQSSPGRAACRCASRRFNACISDGDPNACCAKASSSARCSWLRLLRKRCAAAARLASESSSSSTLRGFSGKNSPCLSMKSSKSCWVSSPRECLSSRLVEVVEHLVDALAVLVGGALQRLLHAGEALVEHLAAQQILDLLVLFAGFRAAPVVLGQLLDSLGRRRRQGIELQFTEAGVVVQRAGQLLAFGQHGLVEQLLDLLQGAV